MGFPGPGANASDVRGCPPPPQTVTVCRPRQMLFPAGPKQQTATTFAIAATKNPLAHLQSKRRVGPNGKIITCVEFTHQQTIEKAFGQTRPQITFNIDVFKDLSLQWIMQTNVSFLVREDTTIRSLCSYLAACQPDYSGV